MMSTWPIGKAKNVDFVIVPPPFLFTTEASRTWPVDSFDADNRVVANFPNLTATCRVCGVGNSGWRVTLREVIG
jgi:hypothetical protein